MSGKCECGAVVSSEWVRVCGDNDGQVNACPNCVGKNIDAHEMRGEHL